MRVVQNKQMTLDEVDLSQIQFNLNSRDDIPKVLRGLQALYVNQTLRKQVFDLLENELLPKVDKSVGRPGMALWNILVCGVVRLDLNIDYDRLHELVNEHCTLRQVLGHGIYNDYLYGYQTIVDNVSLFTPELLEKISTLVVQEGHAQLKKDKGDAALVGRCDSFVVETDVHFPTDISLLHDAIRKILDLTGKWCELADLPDCRQYHYNMTKFKRMVRAAQNKKRSRSKSEDKQQKADDAVKEAHQVLLDLGAKHVNSAKEVLLKLESTQPDTDKKLEIEGYIKHAERQLNQIERRVINGEVIPHDEKVFSIFEPHTEWISKGKAGVPQELGLRVCILEDQHKFILHHRVMVKETDDAVPVVMVKDTQTKFPKLTVCSFDKGFHSPSNQTDLQACLEQVVLPKKGKLSEKAKAAEREGDFVRYRHAHSAVESAINALEVHGLDRCPDHGLGGFKRYVAFAVLARNIHRLGDIMWQRDIETAQRLEKAELRRQEKRAA